MPKSLKQLEADFLEYLGQIRGYSALTLRTYGDALDEALETAEVEQTSEGIRMNLMPYRLRIAKLKAKTISKKLSAVRSFVQFLRERHFEVELEHDESIKVPKTLPKPIAHAHILQAIAHADAPGKMVVTLLYTTGMRLSELASLRLDSIAEGWIRVVGKGNKQRDIPLPAAVSSELEAYLRDTAPKRFVFEKSGKKLSENSLRYIVKKTFKNVGIKATPHQLRHSYATGLLNNHARIADVSELLGHASMATTQIYTKLGNALKLEHYMKSHPLCKGVNETQ